jgi:hypothetical protein
MLGCGLRLRARSWEQPHPSCARMGHPAEKLGIPQGSVSRMERQQDLLLSTLGEYVKALGGRLEMRVVFPEASFELEPLSEKESA